MIMVMERDLRDTCRVGWLKVYLRESQYLF